MFPSDLNQTREGSGTKLGDKGLGISAIRQEQAPLILGSPHVSSADAEAALKYIHQHVDHLPLESRIILGIENAYPSTLPKTPTELGAILNSGPSIPSRKPPTWEQLFLSSPLPHVVAEQIRPLYEQAKTKESESFARLPREPTGMGGSGPFMVNIIRGVAELAKVFPRLELAVEQAPFESWIKTFQAKWLRENAFLAAAAGQWGEAESMYGKAVFLTCQSYELRDKSYATQLVTQIGQDLSAKLIVVRGTLHGQALSEKLERLGTGACALTLSPSTVLQLGHFFGEYIRMHGAIQSSAITPELRAIARKDLLGRAVVRFMERYDLLGQLGEISYKLSIANSQTVNAWIRELIKISPMNSYTFGSHTYKLITSSCSAP